MKLCLLFLLCLCRLGMTEEELPVEPTSTSGIVEDSQEAEEDETCKDSKIFSTEEQRSIGSAIERLGLKLLEKLPTSWQQPNIILSPFSVALALAQLMLGAREQTETFLKTSLYAQNTPCYHHVFGGLIQQLRSTSLALASRMYLRQGFQIKPAFILDSLARYRSVPLPLTSAEEVNQWVSNATDGHILNFLADIQQDVMLMLINAMYFKGEWQTQFDPLATSKGVFYLENQNSVSVNMMKSAQYPLSLLDDHELKAQVASFPFKGNTAFIVVLPTPGSGNVSAVIPKLNISDLYRRLPQERIMQVNLPKMKLQHRQELQDTLTNMGLGSIFSAPNLSGISDQPLRVSSILHASAIELSEEGVEASATTAVTATRSISRFSVNSPFFFALVDKSSMVPLFMGIVTNPAPDDDSRMSNDEPYANSTETSNQQDAELCSSKKELKEEDSSSGTGSSGSNNNTGSTCSSTSGSNNNTTNSSNSTSTISSYSIHNISNTNNNAIGSSSNSTGTNSSYSINETSSSNSTLKSRRISTDEAQLLLLEPEPKN